MRCIACAASEYIKDSRVDAHYVIFGLSLCMSHFNAAVTWIKTASGVDIQAELYDFIIGGKY